MMRAAQGRSWPPHDIRRISLTLLGSLGPAARTGHDRTIDHSRDIWDLIDYIHANSPSEACARGGRVCAPRLETTEKVLSPRRHAHACVSMPPRQLTREAKDPSNAAGRKAHNASSLRPSKNQAFHYRLQHPELMFLLLQLPSNANLGPIQIGRITVALDSIATDSMRACLQ
jgi:hypothetical protein